MAMTVACRDGQQYPRQLGYGQMSSGVSSGHLGKRKRPGSRCGLTMGQVKVNGVSNSQWSVDAVKGEEVGSVKKISVISSSMSTTGAGSLIPVVGSTTTIHINPFRSTDSPSSPKSRRRRIASVKAATNTRDSATGTIMKMATSSPREHEHEHGHEVDDIDIGPAVSPTTDDNIPPLTRTNLSPKSMSQISAPAPKPSALLIADSAKLAQTFKPSSSSSPSSTVTSTESLKPCHICHSRPRQKSDLHKYVDCTRCMRRVCCVCARECAGVDCRARLVCSGCCVEDHWRRDGVFEGADDVGDFSGGSGQREWAGNILCWGCYGAG